MVVLVVRYPIAMLKYLKTSHVPPFLDACERRFVSILFSHGNRFLSGRQIWRIKDYSYHSLGDIYIKILNPTPPPFDID